MKKLVMLLSLLSAIFISSNVLNAQLSGTVYVGTGQTYTSLTRDEAAGLFKSINTSGLNGNLDVRITSDLLNENGAVYFSKVSNYSVTISPSEAVNKTISGTNQGAYDGYPLIKFYGSSSANRVKNITIDGNYNGEGKYLTFQNLTTITGGKTFSIEGYTTNITIKNCNILAGACSSANLYPIYIYGYYNDNLTIENNIIKKCRTGIWLQGIQYNNNTGNKIRNNKIGSDVSTEYIMYTGIEACYQTNLEISGNEVFNIIQSGVSTYGIWVESCDNTTISANNVHDIVYTGTLSYAPCGIFLRFPSNGLSNPNVTIKNNMISHIAGHGSSYPGYYGITSQPAGIIVDDNGSITSGLYIYFNSIYLCRDAVNGLVKNGANSNDYFAHGIVFNYTKSGVDMRNNIFQVSLGEGSNVKNCSTRGYAIWVNKPSGAPNRTVSPFSNIDYNIYYVSEQDVDYIGRSVDANGIDINYSKLADWAGWAGGEAHSKIIVPCFTSTSNLHLTDQANNDQNNYGGIPIAGITIDFDNQIRNGEIPYRGADEIYEHPLPVELTSFTADVSDSDVILKWSTATEVNNYGFEIERISIASSINFITLCEPDKWAKIGFVKGFGNSNSNKHYEYLDKNIPAGRYQYRLIQIDNDGKHNYSDVITIEVISIPVKTYLKQNYPNPFNPVTTLQFGLAEDADVHIDLYNSIGQKAKNIFKGFKSAGNYSIVVDGSDLSDGTYIALFIVIGKENKYSKSVKMILLK